MFGAFLAVIAKPENAKDIGLGAAAGVAYFLNQSWQDTASDVAVACVAILAVLRLVHFVWQWVRGKKPD